MGMAGGGGEEVGVRVEVTSWRMMGSEVVAVSDSVMVVLRLDGDGSVAAGDVPRADF